MFESVTKRRKNPVINFFGWSLLVLVCIVFVFVGFSPNSSFLGSGGAAAEVNGDAISLRDYKELLDRLDNNNQNSDRNARRKLQEDAINILVVQSLIVQEANKLNIHVSDSEVAQALMDIEPFYEDGVFSRLRYKNHLRNVRLTEAEFESKIRRDLIIRKMSNLIGFAAKDLPLVDQFDEKIDQAQINVGFVKITPAQLKAKVDVAAFKAANAEKIKKYYDSHTSEFTTPEQVKARHILIKTDDQSEAGYLKALEKIESIAKDLTTENFSAMAKKHSQDPGSKTRGGELGMFGRGRMVAEFENAAFSTAPGKITNPVKTKFGYHIILVDEKKESIQQPFAAVEDQIAQTLASQSQFDTFTGELEKSISEGAFDKVETAAKEQGLTWSTTGFFSITRDNVPGIGPNKDFLEKAMTLGPDNEYAKGLVYGDEVAYMLKYKGAKMQKPNNQQNQMDFFRQLMKQQRMNAIVQTWADSLRAGASVKVNPDLLR